MENSFFDLWQWKSYGVFSAAHLKPCKKLPCFRLEQGIESLCASADNLAESAEKKGNMLDLTKANSLRGTAKSKKEELEVIDTEIKRVKDNLR